MKQPKYAREYIGWTWSKRGRGTPELPGFDCWGFVCEIHAREYGNQLPPFATSYKTDGLPADVFQQIVTSKEKWWERVEHAEEGDIVVFLVTLPDRKKYTHVGVMLNRSEFIHLDRHIDSTISRVDSNDWKNKLYGIFRVTRGGLVSDKATAPV